MSPQVGEDFILWRPPGGDVSTLGLVDLSIRPMSRATACPGTPWLRPRLGQPPSTARLTRSTNRPHFEVIDGEFEVIPEGRWERLPA